MAAAIPPFDEKQESWDSYMERLENYFFAMDIYDPDKKKAILISSVGPGNYERVRNLCFPQSPNDKDYEELCAVFSQLLTPSIVVFKERKKFYEARKYKTEKATNWHERVRRLALNCKFVERTEQTLLDKFVTSFDGNVFDRFCEEGTDLKLAKALEIAQRYETVEDVPQQKAPFKKPPVKHDGQREQHQFKQKPQQGNQQQQDQGAKPKKFYPPKNVNRPVTNVNVNLNVKKPN